MPHPKSASSQVAWSLLTEGVTSARIEVHRLQHILGRLLRMVEESEYRDRLYQYAGDAISDVPRRVQKLEIVLDRTALALANMGESFLSSRLPFSEKMLVEEAVKPAFGGSLKRESIQRVARVWMEKKGEGDAQ